MRNSSFKSKFKTMANKYASPKSSSSLNSVKPEEVIPNPNDIAADISKSPNYALAQSGKFDGLTFKQGVNKTDAIANLQYIKNSKAISDTHRLGALTYLLNLWGASGSGAGATNIQDFQEMAQAGKAGSDRGHSKVEDFQKNAKVNP
jgi:hypothetical protein